MRLTEDVDILIERSTDNIGQLLAALGDYGEGFARELTLEDFGDEEGAIRIVEVAEMSQINIFTRMSGSYYEDFLHDADVLQLGGHAIRYASKSALIRLKEHSSREKDRIDVIALKRLGEDPDAFE